MGVQLDVHGAPSPDPQARCRYQRPPRRSAEDDGGAAVGRAPARSSGGAAAAASTSGPRPATPRAPPRPRPRRLSPGRRRDRSGPPPAGARRDGAGPGSSELGERASASPSARAPARRRRPGGSSAAPRPPGRRGPRAPPRRGGGGAARQPPTESSSWSRAGGPSPSARSRSAVAGPGSSSRRGAQQAGAGPAAEALGRPSPCSTLQLPPAPSRAPRRRPSSVRPCRCGAASRRSTSSSRARSSWPPGGPFRQLDLLGQLLVGGARAQRLLFAAGRAAALAGRAARSGRRPGRRESRASASRVSIPSRSSASTRSSASRSARAQPSLVRSARDRHRPRRHSPAATKGGKAGPAGGDRHRASQPSADRLPRRGEDPGAVAAVEAAEPVDARRTPPPSRSDSTAAPIASSARTIASVASAAATGSGRTTRPGRSPPERPGRGGDATSDCR